MTFPGYVPPSEWKADRSKFVSDSIRDGDAPSSSLDVLRGSRW